MVSEASPCPYACADGTLMLLATTEPEGLIESLRERFWTIHEEENAAVCGALPQGRTRPMDIIHTTVGRLLPGVNADGTPARLCLLGPRVRLTSCIFQDGLQTFFVGRQ